jgi:hypothetical protein
MRRALLTPQVAPVMMLIMPFFSIFILAWRELFQMTEKLYQRKETYYDFNSLSKPRIVTVVRSGSLERFEG